MCHTQSKTMEKNISGCQTLLANKCFNRDNKVAAPLHLNICKNYGIKVDVQHWSLHNLDWVMDKATILWDSQIIADKDVPYNEP